MNLDGVIIGVGTFLIIGVLHPVVIKTEYHFGTKTWPVFFILGLLCVCLSIFVHPFVVSALLAILGFSLLWSVRELFEQKKRVERGWYPRKPDKAKNRNS